MSSTFVIEPGLPTLEPAQVAAEWRASARTNASRPENTLRYANALALDIHLADVLEVLVAGSQPWARAKEEEAMFDEEEEKAEQKVSG